MPAMVEITGADGESIVHDGATVAKFKHHGKQETARNPVSTFRELRISQKKSLLGKVKDPDRYDALLAMSSLMTLNVDAEGKAALEALAAELQSAVDAGG